MAEEPLANEGTPAEGGAPAADAASVIEATPATEPAPAVEAALEGGKEGAEEKTLAGEATKKVEGEAAPETYADFTLPEGMQLDDAALAAALPVFKDKGFSQEQAQAVVSMYADKVQKEGETQLAEWQKVTADWKTETKDNADFGGDKLDENMGLVARALDTLGTKELREMLDSTGLGNNLHFNKFFAAVGKAIGEDGHVPGKVSGSDTRSAADRMYDAKT